MSYSKLISGVVPASPNNYTEGRNGYKICKFTPHHMAGILTGEQCGRIFQNPNRQASSNYGIGNDGQIWGYVDEENRAWTSANRKNDYQAITVEVSDCEVGGEWKISDAAWNSLVNLAVDVCQRYGFRLTYDGTPNGSLTRHNMFTKTNCPGPYLQSRFDELAETVNAILDGNKPNKPQPEAPTTSRKVGDEVTINGIFTASNSTKKLNPARKTGIITRIIAGARNPYLLDNGNLGWTNDDCIVEEKTQLKSIDEIAQEVIDQKWGNGQERKDRLAAAGYNYNEVQQKVNEKLGYSSKPVQNATINVGDIVRINSNAKKYVTGQNIPSWVKNNSYQVIQKVNKKILLGSIMSWVYESDAHKV